MPVETISAVTLAVRDMARSVEFYQDQVGLEFVYGGREASFTSFRVGEGFLNLILGGPGRPVLVGPPDISRRRRRRSLPPPHRARPHSHYSAR